MKLPGHITGHTRVFALIGHPVRHSLSPQMHTRLFEQLGIDAVYVAFDVNPRDADKVADAIRILGLNGVNLTVPFKERILPHLDRMTVAAEEAGAVNVVTNVDGVLTGYNTDGEGFLSATQEEHGFKANKKKCILLGAGGASRAIAASLAAAGAHEIVMLNRTLVRAENAIAELRRVNQHTRLSAAPLTTQGFASASQGADLVVNCLGGGAEEQVNQLPIEQLDSRAIWSDINYWMNSPPQINACLEQGYAVSVGLGMLIHQGALSFELFTGHPVLPEELQQIVDAIDSASDPKQKNLG